MTSPQDPATRTLRRIGLFSFFCWAMFVAAALPFEAAAPTEGVAETLAVTLELALRIVAKQLASGHEALALAQAYDLAVMPIVQLVIVVYLARVLLGNRRA